jgi:hypothetical protein
MLTNRRLRIAFLALFALALFALTGCGAKKVYPVHGQVLAGKNKPAKGAVVVFHSAAGDDDNEARPVATVDDKGEFVLSTYKNGDGAPVGEYHLTIIWPAPKRTPLDREGGDLLRGRYADPASSPISFTVEKSSDNEVPTIQLH